ncbi:MAG TPA: tRNA modification GTPase [Pirellulales bacterium]|nr:tRNA modification GTPase [Pirellulales bacterium]
MYHPDDTIAAIASAPGGAARGIVRLSGPSTVGCLQAVFQADEQALDLRDVRAARVVSGRLRLGGFASTLPCDIYLWPGSRSYTRQPAAEIHTFGSPPLLAAALRELCEQGARLAQPGEFTLRAFLAGRLDLTQAEAVLGVIDASDRRELDAALSQLAGGLGGELRALRDRLLDLLAHLEAGLDFAEEDIEFISTGELQRDLDEASAAVAALVANMADRGEAAEWNRVVLTGWPNVGKSSLFNALAGKDRAIVSPQPGATRDYLGARLRIGGLACELIDTAGVEPEPAGAISAAAQHASIEQRRQARLELWCLDSTRPPNAWERAKLSQTAEGAPPVLIVLTKTDEPRRRIDFEGIETSSATGAGIESLRERICQALVDSSRPDGGILLGTAVRCRDSLRLAAEDLARALDVVRSGKGEELVAAELRIALDHLGQVVGAVYTDDVLDRVFSRFCIGK